MNRLTPIPRSQPLRTLRTAGALLAFVIGVSGCAGPPGSSAEALVPGSAPASAGALDTSAPALPDELSVEDEALVAELQAEGYSEAEALFIALTEVEVESLGEYSQRILYAFPTGNNADITVTLVPDQPAEAQGTEALVMTSSEPDGGFTFELEYFVPYDPMPADVRDEIAQGTVAVDARLAVAGLLPLSVPVAASDGVGVIVKGLVDKLQGGKASEFLKFLDKQLGTPGALDTLYKQVKAALTVKDALAMQTLHGELQRQLDELEECARNPTNPITRRAYRDDPGYRDQILEQIASVREEVKANTAVMFIAKLNQTAAGLLSKKVKWLSFVVGPLTSWSKAALDEVNAKLIEDLKKNITACEEGYQFEFSGQATGSVAGDPSLVTWHYWGLRCEGSQPWMIWADHDSQLGGSQRTAPAGQLHGYIAITFGADGAVSGRSYPALPQVYSGVPAHILGFGLASLQLSPPDAPTQVTAAISLGDTTTEAIAPVVPADGSIRGCEPAASPAAP